MYPSPVLGKSGPKMRAAAFVSLRAEAYLQLLLGFVFQARLCCGGKAAVEVS